MKIFLLLGRINKKKGINKKWRGVINKKKR